MSTTCAAVAPPRARVLTQNWTSFGPSARPIGALSKTWLTARQVYERFRVSKQTFHNWRNRHKWTTDDRGRVLDYEVRATKLLSRAELRRRGVATTALAEFERAGRVVPSSGGRYSENDVDVLLTPTGSTPPVRRDRQGAIDTYLKGKLRPCDLPDWFWETPEMPPFIAPAGVRGYYYGETEYRKGRVGTWISATVRRDGDEVNPATSRLEWERGPSVTGEVPSRYAQQTDEFEIAKFEWEQEWARRQPRTTSEQAHVMNRPSKATLQRQRRG